MIVRTVTDFPYLKPGYGYIPETPETLFAVVGSGIVVTLYDSRVRLGGMTYYCFPCREPEKPSTSYYAAPAIISLIQEMLSLGACREDIEAQIFGGACNPEHELYQADIHEQNARIGMEILDKQNISVTSQEVGGKRGRKIGFNTGTGETAVIKINSIRSVDWYPQSFVNFLE
ncbi:MAG: chemotaxis protein CheD [SAR324 cluster bacterium]|nr:chemotaxis protein CheD [SAR324 cluster bacterium]